MAAKAGELLVFSDAALRLLEAYRRPGNVREPRTSSSSLHRWSTAVPSNRRICRPPSRAIHTGPSKCFTIDGDRSFRLYDGLTAGQLNFWEDVHRLLPVAISLVPISAS